MNVNSAYIFDVTNINFILTNINSMSIYSNFHIPGRVQVTYYHNISNS